MAKINTKTALYTDEDEKIFESWRVTYDHKEKPEEFLFTWCGRRFVQIHKLNYITAVGAAKVAAGKSMLCHLLMAASLTGEIYDMTDDKNKLTCLVKHCASLYIDCEMGRPSVYTALIRIKQTCEAYGHPTPYHYKQRSLATYIPTKDIDRLVDGIVYYIKNYHVDVIYLDNMVFALPEMDVNNQESAKRIADIDGLCHDYNVTVIIIAHGNKSADDANLAGVAGTAVMRLSAYGLAIEEGESKEPGKFKKVITQKARQGGFEGIPDMCFRFIPFVSGPYESVYPVLGQPLEAPSEDKIEYMHKVFGNNEIMSYTAIKEFIIEDRKYKDERMAENVIKDAVSKSIIVKTDTKKRAPYMLLA